MDVLDEEIRPLVEAHGALTQQIDFFSWLSAMIAQRDRYVISERVLTYIGIALEKSLEIGTPSQIAWNYFGSAFLHLWNDDLETAEAHSRSSLALARQYGDIVQEARSLTYLTLVYRKQGDMAAVRETAAHSLATAKMAELPEYIGMAKANQAWVAWHDKDWALAETYALIALETWSTLTPHHASLSFKWAALWPLIGIKLRSQQTGTALNYARELLDPSQQLLPDEVTRIVEVAIQLWEQGKTEATYPPRLSLPAGTVFGQRGPPDAT